MPGINSQKDTKAILLNVAEQLFLSKGYERVRIREITDQAAVNVAAINYHFGGKNNLYRAVLQRRFRDIVRHKTDRINQVIHNSSAPPDLAKIIDAYVRSFFDDILDPIDQKRLLAMIYQEMSPDAVATDLVASELALPISKCLREAILLALPQLSEHHAAFCASSITGQVLHFIYMREGIRTQTAPEDENDFIEIIIKHITEFSLRGIGSNDHEQTV